MTNYSCPTPISDQIAKLKLLQDNWLDQDSKAPSPGLLEFAERFLLDLIASHHLPTPYLYPTSEGLIQADFPAPDYEIELVISDTPYMRFSAFGKDDRHFEDMSIENMPIENIGASIGRYYQ